MTKENLIIIDYGSGNLHSAMKSFERVISNDHPDVRVEISDKPEEVAKADRIVLPGQGAFRDCMENLKNTDGMIEAMEEAVLKNGTPFLGICVGMQLLATHGMEHGKTAGLNWIEGGVIPIEPKDPSLKVPHMGWNDLSYLPKRDEKDSHHFVLRSTENSENFYFVHSFMVQCKNHKHVLATTEYGEKIPAIIGRDNIIGMQFHPEKSHNAGLRLLSRFLKWKP